MNLTDFLYTHSWYDEKYQAKSGGRYQTFKTALNIFVQRQLLTIYETGTTRMADDWGAGMSTLLFADVANHYGAEIYTVDIEPKNIAQCQEITKDYAKFIHYVVSDSLTHLEGFKGPIGLLYLDSLDYPLTPEEGSVEVCQEHQLKEYLLARDHLDSRSIVLLDDNDFPDGGKCKLTKEQLLKDGWMCLIDAQQSLFIRK
jgi:hypothetical protein